MMLTDNLTNEYIGLIFLLLFLSLLIFFIIREYRHKQTGDLTDDLRPILAFTRLRRAADKAVEAGKQMHISLGNGGLIGLQAASAFIGLSVLRRISKRIGQSDHPAIATSGDGAVAILSEDTLKASGIKKETATPSEFIGQVSGLTPFSYAVGAHMTMQEMDVTSNFLAGHYCSEIGLIIDAGERNEGEIIGGSQDLLAGSILYAGADEPLIGEELFVAGAYLDASPAHIASLRVQDLIRWILAGIILIGSVLKLARLW